MADMLAVHRNTSRRAHSRLRVGIGAWLDTLEGRQKVRLIDLSQGGAHIILLEPASFREGVLTWLRFDVFGEVAWQEGQHLGLHFEELLALPMLVETRQRAPSVVREESLGAERAAQAWVAGSLTQGLDR